MKPFGKNAGVQKENTFLIGGAHHTANYKALYCYAVISSKSSPLTMHDCSVVKGLPIKVVFTVTRANPLQIGDIATQLLDSFNLFMQVVALNEVTHLTRRERDC